MDEKLTAAVLTVPPPLPPGYEAQPLYGFRDRTGLFTYELNRVYGPIDRIDERGPTARVDPERSFWRVTWSTHIGGSNERVVGRWLTYGHARKVLGSRLTFARFSSPLQMRGELETLLRGEDVGGETPGAPSPAQPTASGPGLRPIAENG